MQLNLCHPRGKPGLNSCLPSTQYSHGCCQHFRSKLVNWKSLSPCPWSILNKYKFLELYKASLFNFLCQDSPYVTLNHLYIFNYIPRPISAFLRMCLIVWCCNQFSGVLLYSTYSLSWNEIILTLNYIQLKWLRNSFFTLVELRCRKSRLQRICASLCSWSVSDSTCRGSDAEIYECWEKRLANYHFLIIVVNPMF